MAQQYVNSDTIEASELLVSRPLWQRPYVFPFVVIYPAYLRIYLSMYDELFGGKEWVFIYTLTLVSVHALIWLLPRWNLDMRVHFQFVKVYDLKNATHILMKAKPSNGLSEISPLESNGSQLSFKYQKRKYLWNKEDKKFSPPIFFVDNNDLTIKELKASTGITDFKVSDLLKHYGKNIFDIPIPTFTELFVEHMLAPFFVFQLFSISLWLMDEMWYLSLFSLFMLFSFEATTVFQRKTTMTEFQSMGIKPYDIWVFRNKEWVEIQTDDLLPGDIVSIVRTPHDDLSIPCDLLLLQGSCIVNEAMLSGESTPLLKESIANREEDSKYQPDTLDKGSLLHGGTSCLQVTPPEKSHIPLAPDNGALAIVTKTGFETTQGSLVRVMIFSSERMSVANKEAFFFILFLLVFAVIAARYVWIEGTKMGRVQSKLILDCILVLTSVVPPELPMELTMAVNQSLGALAKHYVYCTEPFRIPVAGRIDVCCFDKTGTLTAEDLFFEGLAGFNTDDKSLLSKCDDSKVPAVTIDLLGSVHALVRLDDGEVVGDPMEKETVKVSGWNLAEKAKNVVQGHGRKIQILKRFQFSSALKRSSVISKVEGKILVGVKGAPETISERITDLPSDYEETYKFFTRSGSRVLALAYKYLDNEKSIDKFERKDIESNLIFGGFIVFHCPMKSDAVDTIQMLNQSSHRCVMITGDNPLTACHVAKEVGIITKDVLILDKHAGSKELEWRNVQETKVIPFDVSEMFDTEFLKKNDLCITGHALTALDEHKQLDQLIRHTWIYSRVSPIQKELVLNTYKALGYNTLMCGDGTNDVGALKQANVGIALLNGTQDSLKQMQENKKVENYQRMYEKQCDLMKRWNQPPPKLPLQLAHLYPPGPLNPHYLKALEAKGTEITTELVEKVNEANKQPIPQQTSDTNGNENAKNNVSNMAESLFSSLQEQQEEEEAPVLKLGDASVAAPFTSKLSNVSAVVNVIRQGRCALVSTIQMYKILALNCLVSAYSLSVLYLAGIKFGDAQATVSGVLLSVCFMSISRGKSIEKLSKERPQPGIFNIYIMGSILGQFAIHLATLIYLNKEIYILEPREPQIDLDKTFSPSLLNTAMFLIQLSQQVSTFAVNYIGRPFREGIMENKGMYYGIMGVSFLCISGATELIPELNEAMQFVPMTGTFKFKLTSAILIDFFAAWAVEVVLKHFFMDFKASDIASRELDDDSAFVAYSEVEKKNN